MSRSSRNYITQLSIAILLGSTLPDVSRADPLPLHITIYTQPEAGLGEPLVLTYRIRNSGNRTLFLARPGLGGRERGKIEGLRSFNTLQSSATGPKLMQSTSLGGGLIRLSPHQNITERYVANTWHGWIPPTQSGQQAMTVQCTLPFKVDTEDSQEAYVYSAEIDVVFRAVKKDPSELCADADKLRERIVKIRGKTTGSSDVDIDSLFSYSPEVAVSVWKQLILDLKPYLPVSWLIRNHLVRLANKIAVDLLADMWGTVDSPKRDLVAREDLVKLYSICDIPLRDYIGKVFVAREGKLPHPLNITPVNADHNQ